MADGSRAEMEAKAFYATIMFATMTGVMMNFLSLSPIKALFWSAVINGIVAVKFDRLTNLHTLPGRPAAIRAPMWRRSRGQLSKNKAPHK
jgi:hypothetical protein